MLGDVHDGSGQGEEVVELGVLLALLHRGDEGFDQVEATYRMWRHDQRAAAARQPFSVAMASGLVAGALAQHVGCDAYSHGRASTPRVTHARRGKARRNVSLTISPPRSAQRGGTRNARSLDTPIKQLAKHCGLETETAISPASLLDDESDPALDALDVD